MPVTHYMEWTIERGEQPAFDVCIDYEVPYGGCPAHMGSLTYPGHPAEGPEIEIKSVWRKADENDPNAPQFELTDDEVEAIEDYIATYRPDQDDDGGY